MKYSITTEEVIYMSITSDLIRGHTDTIILAHLMKKDSYGYEVNKNIKVLSEGMYELKEATLYTAFKRLEDAGSIASYWGDETTGARRKYYRITELGKETYHKLYDEWNTAKHIIDKLVEE
jgi:Predicted transcriptional regulators